MYYELQFRVAPELLTVTNNPNSSYWNVEDGYQPNVDDRDVYPYRMFLDGFDNTLNMHLNTYLDGSSGICRDSPPGIRFVLHVPDELPRMKNDVIHILPAQKVKILVKPKMTKTSSGLHRYTPHVRGCYLRDEHRLRFFRSYSQQKCEVECVANFTRETCDCVQFFLPSKMLIIISNCLASMIQNYGNL